MVFCNKFAELAARARGGDGDAREQFGQELERALVHMVRQTLSAGHGTSPIARRILAVARQVMPLDDFAWVEDRAELEREVAETIRDEMVARLQPAPRKAVAQRESVADLVHGATVLVG